MARSTYVYVALGKGWPADGYPVAAFTVKHELVAWARSLNHTDYKIYRLRDGSRNTEIGVDITDEVLNG